MSRPQWLSANVIGAGAGNQHMLLPDDKRFELTVNLTAIPGVRPFKHFDVKDGKTVHGTAIYNDSSFAAYIIIDAPYEGMKKALGIE